MRKTTVVNVWTGRLLLRPMCREEWTKVVEAVFEQDECLFQFGYEKSDGLREAVAEPNVTEVVYYSILCGDDPVGYVGFSPASKNLEFYVFEECRSQGYACEAVGAFVKACEAGEITGKAVDKFYAQVISDNAACIELMKKLGFTECGCGFSITSGWGFVEFEYVEGKG